MQKHGLQEFFGDVLVPTESVTENVKGQRRTMTRKFFPGYMFVQMVLDDRTFHLVKNTPKITGFLGGMKPTPVPEREITGVQHNAAEGKAGKTKARVDVRAGRVGPRRRWSVRELLGQGRGSQGGQAEAQGRRCRCSAAPRRSSLTSPRSRKHKQRPSPAVRATRSVMKKVAALIKLQCPAGKANPAPPVGPALGQHGLNIMQFCKEFNARTQQMGDLIIPVLITAYSDRSFTFITKTPPASILLKKAAKIEKGSGEPNKNKVGKVTKKQVKRDRGAEAPRPQHDEPRLGDAFGGRHRALDGPRSRRLI